MNLIRNTLLIIVLLQFLGFLYIKFFTTNKKETKKETSQLTQQSLDMSKKNIDSIVLASMNESLSSKPIVLPTSTEYTDNQKVEIPKSTTVKKIIIKKPIEKPKVKKEEKKIFFAQKKVSKTKQKTKKKTLKKLPKIAKKITPKPIHKIKKKKRIYLTVNKKIETYAKRLLGKKYVWGATGPKYYDCSGFTQKVYRVIAGIRLPRVSRNQAKVGKFIKYANLKQGDMVFFDTEKKRTGKVNHVGIYLKHGNFIHASSGGKKVMITNFNRKKFYKNRFLWGRRVIKEHPQLALQISKNKKSRI